MNRQQRDVEHAKNKLAGGIKEVAGKITGNEQLELQGKIESAKADIKKNTNIADKLEDLKDNIAGHINDSIDKNKRNHK